MFGIIGLALSAIASAVGITVNYQAQKAQADLQQQQAKAQAESLREQAEQEEQDQLQRSLIERRQSARRLAHAQTQYNASGVSLSGTPTLALANMAEESELEVIMQEASSQRKRRLLLTDAWNTESFGSASSSVGKKSAGLTALGNGLKAGAKLTDKTYNLDKNEGYW